MKNAWPFFKKNSWASKMSSLWKVTEIGPCRNEHSGFQFLESLNPSLWMDSPRLGWRFSVLCQVSDSAIPKGKGIHTKIMKCFKTINCILLLGLGMFSLILTVFEIFKRIWHIRKSDILGLWFLFKLFKRSWLRVNLRF